MVIFINLFHIRMLFKNTLFHIRAPFVHANHLSRLSNYEFQLRCSFVNKTDNRKSVMIIMKGRNINVSSKFKVQLLSPPTISFEMLQTLACKRLSSPIKALQTASSIQACHYLAQLNPIYHLDTQKTRRPY